MGHEFYLKIFECHAFFDYLYFISSHFLLAEYLKTKNYLLNNYATKSILKV